MRYATRSSRGRQLARPSAVALSAIAALALSACGAADANSTTGEGSPARDGQIRHTPPAASDMASTASFLNQHTTCLNLTPGPEYDASGKSPAWGETESRDPSWGISERAVCEDKFADTVALLTVPDMRSFQAAVKQDGNADFLVGQDFAVVPVNGRTVRELAGSGLRFLTCDTDFSVPSGYSTDRASVDGCVLSNYVPAA
ncbi:MULTISPECIES: hypothetical protein [Streptomyces]|uniref:Lipoprotein n=1 Tax=Streptomyces zinciresistens K42 TaxID=700597 RepID=G2GBC5_9ACTN|nr:MULTISPECIES: hypothetical protein [Streptomyces]EGX59221.1 hypothetical protein SZN_13996 [Streptomyces zinciresistens K42]MDT9696525.1 hypothetical protein [Streptomyces sp. P17]